ncbi:ESPR-type extended signal peptide-containing protein, partial [Ignatzschineria larvae]
MNRIFKVIWNHKLQRKVVTSELGQSDTGNSSVAKSTSRTIESTRYPHNRVWLSLIMAGCLITTSYAQESEEFSNESAYDLSAPEVLPTIEDEDDDKQSMRSVVVPKSIVAIAPFADLTGNNVTSGSLTITSDNDIWTGNNNDTLNVTFNPGAKMFKTSANSVLKNVNIIVPANAALALMGKITGTITVDAWQKTNNQPINIYNYNSIEELKVSTTGSAIDIHNWTWEGADHPGQAYIKKTTIDFYGRSAKATIEFDNRSNNKAPKTSKAGSIKFDKVVDASKISILNNTGVMYEEENARWKDGLQFVSADRWNVSYSGSNSDGKVVTIDNRARPGANGYIYCTGSLYLADTQNLDANFVVMGGQVVFGMNVNRNEKSPAPQFKVRELDSLVVLYDSKIDFRQMGNIDTKKLIIDTNQHQQSKGNTTKVILNATGGQYRAPVNLIDRQIEVVGNGGPVIIEADVTKTGSTALGSNSPLQMMYFNQTIKDSNHQATLHFDNRNNVQDYKTISFTNNFLNTFESKKISGDGVGFYFDNPEQYNRLYERNPDFQGFDITGSHFVLLGDHTSKPIELTSLHSYIHLEHQNAPGQVFGRWDMKEGSSGVTDPNRLYVDSDWLPSQDILAGSTNYTHLDENGTSDTLITVLNPSENFKNNPNMLKVYSVKDPDKKAGNVGWNGGEKNGVVVNNDSNSQIIDDDVAKIYVGTGLAWGGKNDQDLYLRSGAYRYDIKSGKTLNLTIGKETAETVSKAVINGDNSANLAIDSKRGIITLDGVYNYKGSTTVTGAGTVVLNKNISQNNLIVEGGTLRLAINNQEFAGLKNKGEIQLRGNSLLVKGNDNVLGTIVLGNGQLTLAGNNTITNASQLKGGADSTIVLNKGTTTTITSVQSDLAANINVNGTLLFNDILSFGQGRLNIGSDGRIKIQNQSEFNQALSGQGQVDIVGKDAQNHFVFGSNVGNQYAGTYNFTTATLSAKEGSNQQTISGKSNLVLNEGATLVMDGNLTAKNATFNKDSSLNFNGSLAGTPKVDGKLTVNQLNLNGGTVNITIEDGYGQGAESNGSPIKDGAELTAEQVFASGVGKKHNLTLVDSGNQSVILNDSTKVSVNGEEVKVQDEESFIELERTLRQNNAIVGFAKYGEGVTTTNGDRNGLFVTSGLHSVQIIQGRELDIKATDSDKDKSFALLLTGAGGVVLDANQVGMQYGNASNSYTGGTTVKNGTVNLTKKDGFGLGALVITDNGIVNLHDQSQSVTNLKNEGALKIAQDGTLTVSGKGTSTKSDGLQGQGTLVVSGIDAGLTLSADNNNWGGKFDVQNGVLTVQSDQALGSSNVVLAENGVLDIALKQGDTYTFNTSVSGSGKVDINASDRELVFGDKINPEFTGTYSLKNVKNTDLSGDKFAQSSIIIGENSTATIKGESSFNNFTMDGSDSQLNFNFGIGSQDSLLVANNLYIKSGIINVNIATDEKGRATRSDAPQSVNDIFGSSDTHQLAKVSGNGSLEVGDSVVYKINGKTINEGDTVEQTFTLADNKTKVKVTYGYIFGTGDMLIADNADKGLYLKYEAKNVTIIEGDYNNTNNSNGANTGGSDVTVENGGSINNDGGKLETEGGDLSTNCTNTDPKKCGDINNQNKGEINTANPVKPGEGGDLNSGGNINNGDGTIITDGGNVNAGGNIDNKNGDITTGGGNVSGNGINNDGGNIDTSKPEGEEGKGGNVNAGNGGISNNPDQDNQGGNIITDGGNVTTKDNGNLENSGNVNTAKPGDTGGNVIIDGTLDNKSGGNIVTGGGNVSGGAGINNEGKIDSSNPNGEGGNITSGGDLTNKKPSENAKSGDGDVITGGGDIIVGGEIDPETGKPVVDENGKPKPGNGGNLTNNGGVIDTSKEDDKGGNIIVYPTPECDESSETECKGDFTNNGGETKTGGGNIEVGKDLTNQNGGKIDTSRPGEIGGDISAKGDITNEGAESEIKTGGGNITANGNLTNQGGQITTEGGNVSIDNNVTNSGKIDLGGGEMNVGGMLDNKKEAGEIIIGNKDGKPGKVDVTGELKNDGVIDLDGGNLNINGGGSSTKDGGLKGDSGSINVPGSKTNGDNTFTVSGNNSGLGSGVNVNIGKGEGNNGNGHIVIDQGGSLGEAGIKNDGTLTLVGEKTGNDAVKNNISGQGHINIKPGTEGENPGDVELAGDNSGFGGTIKVDENGNLIINDDLKHLGGEGATVNLETDNSHLTFNNIPKESDSNNTLEQTIKGQGDVTLNDSEIVVKGDNSNFNGSWTLGSKPGTENGGSSLTVSKNDNLGGEGNTVNIGASSTLVLDHFNKSPEGGSLDLNHLNSTLKGDGTVSLVNTDLDYQKDKANDFGGNFDVDQNSNLKVKDNGFNHGLTGNGQLTIDANQGEFNFGGNVGSDFAGTVNINNGQLTLNDNNSNAVSKGTLNIGSDSNVSFEKDAQGNQELNNVSFGGGQLTFNNGISQEWAQMSSTNVLNTNTLDFSNGGTVRVEGMPEALDPSTQGLSLIDLNVADNAYLQLASTKEVKGDISELNLELTDQQGQSVKDKAVNITNKSTAPNDSEVVAEGIFAYDLRSEDKSKDKGLFVNYQLTGLAILDGKTVILEGSKDKANAFTALISDKSGNGNLEIRNIEGSAVILNNSKNSYSGTTTVVSGSLIAGITGALGTTSMLIVSEKATFDLNGTEQTVGGLTVRKDGRFEGTGVLEHKEGNSGIFYNAGTIQVGMSDAQKISNEDTINHLKFNSALRNEGALDLRGPKIGNTLTITGNYEGAGDDAALHMNAHIMGNHSATGDQLIIEGKASGQTNVFITTTGVAGQLVVGDLAMIKTGGSTENAFKYNDVKKGSYEQFLVLSNDNWYLTTDFEPTEQPGTGGENGNGGENGGESGGDKPG